MQKILSTILFVLLIPVVTADVFLHDYIYEGETKVIPVNGGYYEIQLIMVSDIGGTALFSVNGELTKALREREKDYLLDGSRIFTGDILIDEDGRDLVEFYFSGTGRKVIHETISELEPVPSEEVAPGLLEEQPTILPACEGCTMNGDCFAYGYSYDADFETSFVCAEDGSWREQVYYGEPIDVSTVWDDIINWIISVWE